MPPRSGRIARRQPGGWAAGPVSNGRIAAAGQAPERRHQAGGEQPSGFRAFAPSRESEDAAMGPHAKYAKYAKEGCRLDPDGLHAASPRDGRPAPCPTVDLRPPVRPLRDGIKRVVSNHRDFASSRLRVNQKTRQWDLTRRREVREGRMPPVFVITRKWVRRRANRRRSSRPGAPGAVTVQARLSLPRPLGNRILFTGPDGQSPGRWAACSAQRTLRRFSARAATAAARPHSGPELQCRSLTLPDCPSIVRVVLVLPSVPVFVPVHSEQLAQATHGRKRIRRRTAVCRTFNFTAECGHRGSPARTHRGGGGGVP